jgi:fatty-acyl-CoA synthase
MTAADHSLMDRFRRIRLGVVIAAVALAILAPLAVIGGAVGVRAHLFSLHVGFDWLSVRVAPALAVVGLALGGLGLIAALIPPRRGMIASLVAIAIGALTFGVLVQSRAKMAQTPPIHDVSTDWTLTQLFSARLMADRGPLANPLETNPVVPQSPAAGALAGQYVGVVNAKTCPAATPVTLTLGPAQAYVRVRAAVLVAGLALVTDDPADGVIEATHTSPLFGFKDDISLSLHPAGAGTRIDMRASARTGQSDFGRDCRLVTRLRSSLAR